MEEKKEDQQEGNAGKDPDTLDAFNKTQQKLEDKSQIDTGSEVWLKLRRVVG